MLHNHEMPNYMLIGVRKGATSWIWKQLDKHPDIETHPNKEIHFFNKFYHKGIVWYKKQFKWLKKVIIDTTPDYFEETCAERIKTHFPKIRMMVSLRNPIERAFSHFKFSKFYNRTESNFKMAWKKDWRQMRTKGLYDKHLYSFYDRFPKQNLLVMFHDDIKISSENFSNKMYDYMDVPRITSEFRNMRWMPGENTCWKKIEGQKKDYEKRYEKYKEYNKKEILNNDDFKMMCDYYEEPIKNLEKIVNRDFSNWLKIENIEC